MEQFEVKCRGCGKKLLTYSKGSCIRYRSPLKTCRKCGTKYADPRCREIALEGIPGDTFSITSYLVLAIIGGLILYRGIYLFGRHQLGTPDSMQWMMPTVISFIGAVMTIGGLIEMIAIWTGWKKKWFERLGRESEIRMQNKSYVFTLQSLGYDIPKKYL